MKHLGLVLVVLLVGGCAKTGDVPPGPDFGHGRDFAVGGGDDLSTGMDGSTGDLPLAVDLKSTDLPKASDMPSTGDLSSAGDMPPSGDLATADLSGPPADLAMCVLFPQSGCNVNEKCEFTGSSNSCVSNGTKQNGQQCGTAGSDDCVAGDICSSDSAAGTFMCRAFCNTDGDCKQPAVASGTTAEPGNVAHCIVTFTGTTQAACTFACNPVTAAGASGCPTGLACLYGGTATIPELTDCVTPGASGDGVTCTDSTTCAAGFVCVGSGAGTSSCRQVCRNGRPGDCAGAGYSCDPPAGVTSPMFGFCCPAAGC